MKTYSGIILLIGLVFDVLLCILVVISCLLIYSLLLISVQTKSFEYGVMRLVGLTKKGYVAMIMTQAAMFVLPSVILGFLLSVPCLAGVWSIMFANVDEYRPSIIPNWSASIQALTLGLLIPLISSIIPVRKALSKTLSDSLTFQRPVKSGVKVSIVNNQDKNISSYLIFGTVAVLFGVSIYFVLPLGLITQSLGLILIIFLIILLGMITGLTLFASNFQGFLEKIYVYLFFFWEKKSMRALLRTNLKAHKDHNFLTSVIYSLTLGCAIFLLVTANLSIKSQQKTASLQSESWGANIVVKSPYVYGTSIEL